MLRAITGQGSRRCYSELHSMNFLLRVLLRVSVPNMWGKCLLMMAFRETDVKWCHWWGNRGRICSSLIVEAIPSGRFAPLYPIPKNPLLLGEPRAGQDVEDVQQLLVLKSRQATSTCRPSISRPLGAEGCGGILSAMQEENHIASANGQSPQLNA